MLFSSVLAFCLLLTSCSQPLTTPAEATAYEHPSTSDEVNTFIDKLSFYSPAITSNVFGTSASGKPLHSIHFGNHKGKNPENKLRVLVFAQQHGNEPSGKEALLLLSKMVAKGAFNHWHENMELWLVPQLNPEGADAHERRNAQGIDLNRDHVLLQAHETQALHALFHEVMPHVTIDIHEYQPFRESWKQFGAYKTFDVQAGIITNPNVNPSLVTFSSDHALPAIEQRLNKRGFTFHNYIVGPTPDKGRTRHSTVDIDDGRHSFAIMNTMAFIFEGINARDGFAEGLERRTVSQYEALVALLDLLGEKSAEVIAKVEYSRAELHHPKQNEAVAIRMEHVPDGRKLALLLESASTGKDTLVHVEEYHPVVEARLFVERPLAYLLPKNDSLLMQLLEKHRIRMEDDLPPESSVWAYHINEISMSVDEEIENRFPAVAKVRVEANLSDYVIVPVNQIKSNFLVLSFEPQSMIGLAQYEKFSYLLEAGKSFPILRVEP